MKKYKDSKLWTILLFILIIPLLLAVLILCFIHAQLSKTKMWFIERKQQQPFRNS